MVGGSIVNSLWQLLDPLNDEQNTKLQDLLALADGFILGFNQKFLIADVEGYSIGNVAGLSEGDLVGSFEGMDLFISYFAGDGNDVALLTAVPEPTSGVVLLPLVMLVGSIRVRRQDSV